jgi:hypothetical protein
MYMRGFSQRYPFMSRVEAPGEKRKSRVETAGTEDGYNLA